MVVLQCHSHDKSITGFKGTKDSQWFRVLHIVGHKTVDGHHVCKRVGGPGVNHRHIDALTPAGAARAITRIEGSHGNPGGRRCCRFIDNCRLDQLGLSSKGHALDMHHPDQSLGERVVGWFM